MQSQHIYLGIMSGTSLDGVDTVAMDFSGDMPKVIASHFVGYPSELRGACLSLQSPHDNELHHAQIVANSLADLYSQCVVELIQNTPLDQKQIAAVGVHGQTIRHRPESGYTIQLNQPARIAEQIGLTVVSDFRARDIAAGGQGAPLVPAFHNAIWRDAQINRVVLNLGGFANISVLNVGQDTFGFDTGPANVLMDAWINQHNGLNYDRDGAWAKQGTPNSALLSELLSDPYFSQPHPKSTGRDKFHMAWLNEHLRGHPDISAVDVQATLLQLTLQSILNELKTAAPQLEELIVCGGGAYNSHLIELLTQQLPSVTIRPSNYYHIDAEHVEAAAFAWLAAQTMQRQPGNMPQVTGANGLRILGNITLA